MKNSQNKKTLQIVLIVLVAVLTLGIGYATISNINLIIDGNATANPNDNNFKVYFVETADTPNLTGNVTLTGSADIDKDDNTLATFNVGGLTKEGDYAIATYTIINNSNDVGAKLSLELTNSNADYFKVTETITDTELQAGDTTTGTVKVEMIKTPVTETVSTSITAKIKATAVENDSATKSDTKSVAVPKQYVYTVNSQPTYTYINQAIPNEVSQYNSFNISKTAFGHPTSLAHILEGGIIKESYVVFEKNGEVYYLRGGAGNEFGQTSMPIYESNVSELKKAFGPDWESVCSETVNNNSQNFICVSDDLLAGTGAGGGVSARATDSSWYCNVPDNGNSVCKK